MIVSRRTVGRLALGGLASLALPPVLAEASKATHPDYAPVRMTDSDFGSFTQSWFLESFLELADDLEEARGNGKRFAVMWELDGCPYCRETHLVNFAIPGVTDYIRDNFDIIQLDLKGSREVVDFDGTTMSERDLAKQVKVRFTPTIQFFPETLDELKGKSGKEMEVARIPGYLRPFHFLTYFQFVREKAYEKTNFHKYLKARVADLNASGKGVPAW